MISSILGIVEAALSIWASKEKTKYIDELKELKLAYYEELNKPEGVRSDAVLDHLINRLRIITDSIAAGINSKNA